jgi:hypothetical protein
VTDGASRSSSWPREKLALLRATLALTPDQRLDWLEEMMAIAIESGALPKRVPDQIRGARPPRPEGSRES